MRMRVRVAAALALVASVGVAFGAAPARRVLQSDDVYRMQAVDGLSCASDGTAVVYSVTRADRGSDELKTAIWTVDWAGAEARPLTSDGESASQPSFSPDGRYVSFLASRGAGQVAQLYLLDRRGGEAFAVTDVRGQITGYQWSPDGRRVVLVLSGKADGEADAGQGPKPIVIDRFHFKEDQKGYLTAADRSHLFLLDVATRELTSLTAAGDGDEQNPAWSPDGRQIAYVGSQGADADRTGAAQVYLVEPRAGAVPRRIAEFYRPASQSLLWMTDGRRLVYSVGLEPRLNAYIQDRLALTDVAKGTTTMLAADLDRPLSRPVLTGAPNTLGVLVEDDRWQYPAVLDLGNGRIVSRVSAAQSVTQQCSGAGRIAVLASSDAAAPEIHALEAGRLRPLTHHNRALLDELELGAVVDIGFASKDGTQIHGLLTRPVGYVAGRRYPTILWIHGGPSGQDQHGLSFDQYPLQLERQWFAAHGYAVLAINYRGGSGRGQAFQSSIVGDWGHLEVEDLLAGIEYAVASGIADPDRLGIGGWSYGGILTDYVIATDTRFKAAISGAGSGNQLSTYGSDEYVLQYTHELGEPWRAPDLWIRLSYPFFHADRIHTPTLFLGGDRDFNVPIVGGEQMYQALRSLGVATQLVVYPGEYHLLARPSFIKDRIERYLAWFDRYLQPGAR